MTETQTFKPTKNKQRIKVIDALRGFALIGLPFVNIFVIWRHILRLSGTEFDIGVQRFLYIFVEGRFFSIFSFLFGLGIWIFLSRLRAKGNPISLYVRRMLFLLAVGIIHQFLQPGEALLFYAVLGFILLFVYIIPKRINLILGIAGVLLFSILSIKLFITLPCMVLGVAFGQYRIFEKITENIKVWQITLIGSFVLVSISSLYLWTKAPELGQTVYMEAFDLSEAEMQANDAFYQFMNLALKFTPLFLIFYVSFIVVIHQLANSLLKPLEAYGKMAFTNYLGQTILLIIISFFITSTTVSHTFAFITCIFVVLFQIAFSVFWLKRFSYGPFEWIWRSVTYKQKLPIK